MLWLAGVLVLGQTLISLLGVRRWLRFMREYRPAGAFTPPLTLVVPCRGSEPGLRENLAAYARQDYPDFELLFVTSGPEDSASAVAGSVAGARLLHAAPRPDEGQKVTKLRAAVGQARASSEVFVFADSDGCPHREWLRELVAPLDAPESAAGATTGYRWYIPASPGMAADLRAAWNSFIASLLGNHPRNFCWGGSMAIRRATFDRLDVDRYWRGSVSDDYQLTRALKEAGLPIRFVPGCLVPDASDCSWSELFSWTTRQITITRVYAPRLWRLGLAANGFYCAGVAALIWALPSPPAVMLLSAIVLASMATGSARAEGARAALPSGCDRIRRRPFVLFAPLVPLLLLANFVAAGLTRTITWRGTSYRLEGPQRVMSDE